MSTPQIIPVQLGTRSYPIHIGQGVLSQAVTSIREACGGKNPRCIIISDSHVGPLYAQPLFAQLQQAGMAKDAPIILPAGEASKSFTQLEKLLGTLFALEIDRATVLVALGGGVIGDLVGFAAAVALRGLPFVQIPTTLLAQVDSSVGGKTAINAQAGKNLVGAFHQPRCVLIDLATLGTLPAREWKAGYAEVVKYGLLGDADFFNWLEAHGMAVLKGDGAALAHAIATSVKAKAAIVARDEKENDVRALLNLGHTFAHAYESAAHFDGSLLHGEAVALGMVQAFQLSQKMGLCSGQDTQRVIRHFNTLGLPTSLKGRGWKTADLLATMRRDKKAANGALTFILVRGIGQAFVEKNVAPDLVETVLNDA